MNDSVHPALGATIIDGGVRFAIRSRAAERIFVSIFTGEAEMRRVEARAIGEGLFVAEVDGVGAGTHYGLRADGIYDPASGCWFDPDKLLVDPYAVAIDRPYTYDPRLAAPRHEGGDTAPLVPKSIVTRLPPAFEPQPPLFSGGGLVYEVNVRGFTIGHPDVPQDLRGRIAALAHPAIVAHLKKLGVAAVELMPIVAWIDERHLPPLGLRNAWGYNPVTFKPLDPRLAPGGITELRQTVAALREAGIGVLLDLVFNHTGESDDKGPTLSLRGLDNRSYFRSDPDDPGLLVNDTGTGNTIACDNPDAAALIVDALRHFVAYAGVDGFRFDLATVLGREGRDFDPDARLFDAILTDPMLSGRVMIVEPWDVGPDGYQLGNFPPPLLEWNDRFRDDIRRFWRGDPAMTGTLATRLAGSSDVFRRVGQPTTRSVNFIAAHDGFSLADLVSYQEKHNEANGEENRDGHGENFSWNNGVEGEAADSVIATVRRRDLFALLSTLFASRGAIMLTAGDEFGRTQSGNNNAYAQDDETTWLDWERRDGELEAHVGALAAFRRHSGALNATNFLDGRPIGQSGPADVEWLAESGEPLSTGHWGEPDRRRLTMVLTEPDGAGRVAVLVNGDRRASAFNVPVREGFRWSPAAGTGRDVQRMLGGGAMLVAGRSVIYLREERRPDEGKSA
ncbi:glycogen debranching protein GlgX [Mesorhizobium sp. BAC0120]|uniref:glycogen debranching protein GlgX n=1 Tax=Mesorhizobium sp. BAC0120 TaxID=3090670 RepID=UPI00298D4FE6|nr:glycogen debranching protein GlgX [Mesorhizobium sp. BAC0120]MDW6020989.1 glycogen debranching protein GlgX [Mesorhizobium sp. BAC0120]